MQAITHFLVGIIFQILLFPISPPVGMIIGILLSIFSHFLIDPFAKITYHPASPHEYTRFWIITHIIFYIAGAVVFIYFWNPYCICMGFSVLIDIYDWGIIRGISYMTNNPNWLQHYRIHPYMKRIRNRLLFWLPDWNNKHYGVISEILIIVVLLYLVFYLQPPPSII